MLTKDSALPLLGYSDKLSGRPGDTIAFKVSAVEPATVTARLARSISADPNPQGPGIVEEPANAHFPDLAFDAVYQPVTTGSFMLTEQPVSVPLRDGISVAANVFPTLRSRRRQCVLSCGGLSLYLDESNAFAVRIGDCEATTGHKIVLRNWYRIVAGFDPGTGTVFIRQTPMGQGSDLEASAENAAGGETATLSLRGPIMIAANGSPEAPTNLFNGKIEGPGIYSAPEPTDASVEARWDFSVDISSLHVHDAGPDGIHGILVNHPARAMTGSNWDGKEMAWRHAPDQYGAIHFHEDDAYDFGWETSFTFTIPDGMPSGVYIMRISAGGHEDAMPIFVCAPLGRPNARLCVLVSTYTYAIYGNHARLDYDPAWQDRMADWKAYPHNPAVHPDYGLSTYNDHSDGSGICHASWRRPLFTLRPGYLSVGYDSGSGLRHFQADSHLISWLHAKGIDYDIVTDHELNQDGIDAIRPYDALTTGSHPEYHTVNTLDALTAFRDGGGNLMYLGGNGFYWRVAIHPDNEALIEVRRAEGGIRAWAAEPGEYYHAFDGTYGGIWRRNGRPPQKLAGIGFTAQGQFFGSPYRRTAFGPDTEWIFEGIEDEILGDFGFSGGGAAGFELDRMDVRLGSLEETTILAHSETQDTDFVLVPEELLTHLSNTTGEPNESLLRADMVYFEVPGGGKVFSTGSITFCGSLPWNGFDNNISRLLENIVRNFTRAADEEKKDR